MNQSLDFKKGRKSERNFKSYLEKRTNYKVQYSTGQEDIHEHIDLHIEDPDGNVFGSGMEKISVDIKSKKNNRISDDNVEIRSHVVEFQNIKGNKGWLLGDADFIVFETVYYWIVVNRMKLFKFAYRTTDFNNVSKTFGSAFYRPYQRTKYNHKDIITRINCLDLMYLSQVSYPKKRKIYE